MFAFAFRSRYVKQLSGHSAERYLNASAHAVTDGLKRSANARTDPLPKTGVAEGTKLVSARRCTHMEMIVENTVQVTG